MLVRYEYIFSQIIKRTKKSRILTIRLVQIQIIGPNLEPSATNKTPAEDIQPAGLRWGVTL
jgi:hypothetical protein